VALFLPLVSSVVALSIIWKAIFSPTREAPLNLLVGLFGVPPQNWLANPTLVIPAIVGFEIWRGYGFWVILFLAGLDAIPAEIHDAASVDGANAWQKFWRVTLPLLRPTVLFLSVMGLIWNFQLFDAVYMLTGGGPANSSATIVWYVYRSAFHFEKLGYGATMGVLLLIVILALTLIQLRMGRSETEY
jgi:multiple sugar transport system permease protein